MKTSNGASAPTNYTAGNYVQYKTSSSMRRDDERSLPFFPLYQRALRDAARGGAESWEAAKSTFGELWQQMIFSDDLTSAQAKELFDAWRKELIDARQTGRNNKLLSQSDAEVVDERVSGAASVLRLKYR